MNTMFGMTGIKVKIFNFLNADHLNELNDFLNEHDGNIIDMQYQHSNCFRVMVVYKEVE